MNQDISILELGLSVRSENALRAAGINTLSELLERSVDELWAIPSLGKRSVEEILAISSEYRQPVAHGESNKNILPKISDLNISVRLKNALLASGLMDINDIVALEKEQFFCMKNMGRTSIKELEKLILNLGLSFGMTEAEFERKSAERIKVSPGSSNSLKKEKLWGGLFPENLRTLRLQHICEDVSEMAMLGQQGVNNALDLLNYSEFTFNGKSKTVHLANKFSNLLGANFKSPNDFSVDAFLGLESVNTLVVPRRVNRIGSIDGDLLRTLSNDLVRLLPENMAKILAFRVWPEGSVQPSTLEEVASGLNVTRERVRQIEKKLLVKLYDLFFGKGYILLPQKKLVSLHPEITGLFKKASQEFRYMDEQSIETILTKLSSVWNASEKDLYFSLPILIAAMTQSTTTDFTRSYWKNDVGNVYYGLSGDFSDISLSDLRLGKITEKFNAKDVYTLEDLANLHIDSSNSLAGAQKKVSEAIISIQSRQEKFGLDKKHSLIKGLGLYESEVFFSGTPESFFSNFLRWVETAIPYMTAWSNCLEVFQMRTSKAAAYRATLATCADEILHKPKHGPVIARIEKYLIEQTAKALIDKNFSTAYVWIPAEVLQYLSISVQVYNENRDSYDRFVEALGYKFGTSEVLVRKSSHFIWALNVGLLPNRYFHLKQKGSRSLRKSQDIEQLVKSSKVRLVGFREIH